MAILFFFFMSMIYLILTITFILSIGVFSSFIHDKIDRFLIRRMRKKLSQRKKKEEEN